MMVRAATATHPREQEEQVLLEVVGHAGYEVLTRIRPPFGLLPVPPWTLREYQAAHSHLTLDELGDEPFGVLLFDGDFITTTLNAFRAPGPFPPGREPSVIAVIELYNLLASVGVLIWDPVGRIVVQCGTNATRKRLLRHWWAAQGQDRE